MAIEITVTDDAGEWVRLSRTAGIGHRAWWCIVQAYS